MILVLLFVAVPVFGVVIEIPPEDPKCAADEESSCVQSCQSTLLACSPFGYWEDGVFKQTENWDCNTTTCGWNCICIKGVKP